MKRDGIPQLFNLRDDKCIECTEYQEQIEDLKRNLETTNSIFNDLKVEKKSLQVKINELEQEVKVLT